MFTSLINSMQAEFPKQYFAWHLKASFELLGLVMLLRVHSLWVMYCRHLRLPQTCRTSKTL